MWNMSALLKLVIRGGRDPTVGHGALEEQIVLEAESGDHSVWISVPFGPEQNHLRFGFHFLPTSIDSSGQHPAGGSGDRY